MSKLLNNKIIAKVAKQPKNIELTPTAKKVVIDKLSLISKQTEEIKKLNVKKTANIREVLTDLRAYSQEVRNSDPIFAKYPKGKLAVIVKFRVESDKNTNKIVSTALDLMINRIEIKAIDKLSLSAIQYIIKKILDTKCKKFTASFTKNATEEVLSKAMKEERAKDAMIKAKKLVK